MAVEESEVSEVISGRRAISADLAERLGRAFGTRPQFWLNLQARYEAELA